MSPPGLIAVQHRTQISAALASSQGDGTAVSGVSMQNLHIAVSREQHCSDTCHKARDGKCDEGRPCIKGPSSVVSCDLGTDCTDCGAWTGSNGFSAQQETFSPSKARTPAEGPISYILRHDAVIRVKETITLPSFTQPITNHANDPDVSAMLEHYGAMEGGVTRAVYEVLNGRCVKPDGERALVLNVGANFGYYALYAAMLGCRVVAWEPVPLFRAFLMYSAALNNVSHLVSVRGAAVGRTHGSTLNITIPKLNVGTYWGLASVDGNNVLSHEVGEAISVPSESLDGVLAEEVRLLIADVEGWEAEVTAGAEKLIAAGKILNLLLEHSPGVHERLGGIDALLLQPTQLANLVSAGYRIGHLRQAVSTPWPPTSLGYGRPFPTLESVSLASLKHDIAAARMLKEQKESGTCGVHERMKRFGPWASCGEWAYGAHPKGFRSSFGFNTNVWATLEPLPMMALEGNASLFEQDQDMKVWTAQRRPNVSTGHLPCSSIGAGHAVLFHCKCSIPQVCGEEERALQELLDSGEYPTPFAVFEADL
ncbi:MAG: hypothetical protein WDW36_006998 [Sanguina aurantia]